MGERHEELTGDVTIDDALVDWDVCSPITVTRISDDPADVQYTWEDPSTPYCAVDAEFEPFIAELPWKLRRITSLGDSLFGEVIVYRREDGA
jgi:hypothetical protein